MIRVKWNKSHPAFGYFAGQQGEVDDKHIEMLSNGGYVQVLPGDDGDDNPLPTELPARDLLHENGYTLEKLKGIEAKTLQEINGIGPKTSEEIVEFLAE